MTMHGTVVMLGLPQTAKSTYLGALWQLIQDDQDASIEELDVTGDRAYLQGLGERVSALEAVPRTDVDSSEGLALTLRFSGNREFSLTVPDVSGEALRVLVEDRLWHPRLLNALEGAAGLMLFIHPARLQAPLPTTLTAEALSGIVDDDDFDTPRFSPRRACTAAQLIDALENVLTTMGGNVIRVAVIVSAWDMVDGTPTPEEWMRHQAPALLSYLENAEGVEFQIFGISAQGGRLPEDRRELLKKGSVRERAFSRDASGAEVPLSRPLEWALFG
jgi:hypothetical protein